MASVFDLPTSVTPERWQQVQTYVQAISAGQPVPAGLGLTDQEAQQILQSYLKNNASTYNSPSSLLSASANAQGDPQKFQELTSLANPTNPKELQNTLLGPSVMSLYNHEIQDNPFKNVQPVSRSGLPPTIPQTQKKADNTKPVNPKIESSSPKSLAQPDKADKKNASQA